MNSQLETFTQTPTINAYRHSAKILKDRLKWDLNPQSWRSRAALKKLHNSRMGEKAIVVCNGPSLLKTDLSLLKGVFTFGLNKINLLFPKTEFRPSAIVAMNSFVIEQNREFYNETNIPLFLDTYALSHVRPKKTLTFLHCDPQAKFARDVSMSVWQGATVTSVALQLAYHIGFKYVALVGCDHSFAEKGPANKTVVAGAKDHSHFDPNYFAGGVKWQLPDLVGSEYAYSMARETFEASNRKIFNCTEGGQLEIFERLKLTKFLTDL